MTTFIFGTIVTIVVIVGGIVALISHRMIKKMSHRPANGELKTLERITQKVDSLSHHPVLRHSSIAHQ